MTRRSVPALRLAIGALAAFVVAASPAAAAVPRDGATFKPRSGAELLEAVGIVGTLVPTGTSPTARIELAATTYVINRELSLTGNYPVEIVGPESGGAIVTNGGATPTRLLHAVTGENNWSMLVRYVEFDERGTTASAFSVVDAGSQVILRDVSVEVPTTMPAVTAVRLRTESAVNGIVVDTGATDAPAVRVEPGASLHDIDLTGGEPTVQVPDVSAFRREVGIAFGAITGGPTTKRLIAVDGVTGEQRVSMGGLTLRPGPATDALIDVAGATGPPFAGYGTDLSLAGVTLLGRSGVTGIRVAPGVAGSQVSVIADGILSLGGGIAIGCAAGGTQPLNVLVRGIYREGELSPGAACTIDEQGRRTGDPKFRDRAAGDLEPLWGSTLIDGAPGFGSSKGYGPVDEWIADIGAIEYEYTPAELEQVTIDEPGNRGLVRLEAVAHDQSAEEDATYGLTYRWRFSDGTELWGANATHRLEVPEDVDFMDWYPGVELVIFDVSGTQHHAYIQLDPWVMPCEPATDADEYERGDLCPDPNAPTPTPTPSPSATPTPSPQSPNLPTPTPLPGSQRPLGGGAPRPTPTPKPAPAPRPLLSRFEVIRGRASSRARRASGFAATRPSEAAIRMGFGADAKVELSLERKGRGAAWAAVPGAQLSLTAPRGLQLLRLTTRFGKARLSPGLYRLTAKVTPASASTAPLPAPQQALVRIARERD